MQRSPKKKRGDLRTHGGERPGKKSQWGALKGRWVPPDTRDEEVVDYVGKWTQRAELPAKQLLSWIGLSTSKYHLWRQHYGRPHAHNSHIPRDGWLEAWEKRGLQEGKGLRAAAQSP